VAARDGGFQLRPRARTDSAGISGNRLRCAEVRAMPARRRRRMRAHLDTAVLVAEPADRRRVLFLVHRAADGWLALDLTGDERTLAPGLRIVRGGDAFPRRVFSLYALDLDPEACRGLRVPSRSAERFGFGGDLTRILAAAAAAQRPRLILFRGLTRLDDRSRSAPPGVWTARASAELVFEAPRGTLWAEVRRIALASSAPPRSRWGNVRRRGAARGSARARRG
jgi:hypothetical protein